MGYSLWQDRDNKAKEEDKIKDKKLTPKQRYDAKNKYIYTLAIYRTKDQELIDELEQAQSKNQRIKDLCYKGLEYEKEH